MLKRCVDLSIASADAGSKGTAVMRESARSARTAVERAQLGTGGGPSAGPVIKPYRGKMPAVQMMYLSPFLPAAGALSRRSGSLKVECPSPP